MKKEIVIIVMSIFLCKSNFAQEALSVNYFNTLPKLSIRALEVLNDNTVWFAANQGVWAYTEDAGKTWHIDSLKVDSVYPQFRSIAVLNDSTVLLLGISSPAYLLKTSNKGKTWKVVYKNAHPKAFFDSMVFYDKKNGFAIGDPINSKITLIRTTDGGDTWMPMDDDKIGSLEEGEACFATSNTNLDIHKNMLWFVTGGKRSRLFYSSNLGKSFLTYNTPIPQGETMAGIFSFDFFNEKLGVAAGGNYDKTDSSIVSLALTKDGGKTWNVIKHTKPFFGSCVRFRNTNEVFITGHDGTFRYNIKNQRTEEIKDTSGESLKFMTLRFSPSGKTLWMAGSNGKIVLVSGFK
ncbi:MAG: hypothetical protein KBG47_07120 [Bacteroidia bacterium]|jgi:photosystem II stability/assembly factor-like uncharacterized protein|nr:hypothetical protein [Bacteroidia bacterium]